MTRQEHCTTLFVYALYYYYIEKDKLNGEAIMKEAATIASYPWYKERAA